MEDPLSSPMGLTLKGRCLLLPVSQQAPQFPSKASLQEHVHVFVILECAIQPVETDRSNLGKAKLKATLAVSFL